MLIAPLCKIDIIIVFSAVVILNDGFTALAA